MNKAVFLDRDGVINKAKVIDGKPMSPRSLNEVEFEENIFFQINRLKEKGFKLVVVTNQPDIARGHVSREQVDKINNYIKEMTNIEHFYVCPHDNEDYCECRKPKPGMLLNASKQLDIDCSRSYLVGDRSSDISAGQKVECNCLFIDKGYIEIRPSGKYFVVKNLEEAVDKILAIDNMNEQLI